MFSIVPIIAATTSIHMQQQRSKQLYTYNKIRTEKETIDQHRAFLETLYNNKTTKHDSEEVL